MKPNMSLKKFVKSSFSADCKSLGQAKRQKRLLGSVEAQGRQGIERPCVDAYLKEEISPESCPDCMLLREESLSE
jgi:hypothetical protein